MKIKGIFSDGKGKSIAKAFFNKDILITGGCGSIGSEIVCQLIKFNPKRIRIFDNNESGLFYLQQSLNSPMVRVLVGDIRDKNRMRMAVRDVDIVFHAAALKHVPLCEYNPFEAVRTNVLGTQNLLEVVRDAGVERFISISTDKAVNPINTMGATKLLSEKLVMTANIGERCRTKFSCVRFGNVLNSVGSVIPVFREQIKCGGPLTITSSEMTRFFMSMPEAVNLVLKAAHLTQGGEIFILKMRRIRIIDLAKVMIREIAPLYNFSPESIKIKYIGVRPGEKIDELLVTEEEKNHLIDRGDFGVLRPGRVLPHKVKSYNNLNKGRILDINAGALLCEKEVEELFRKFNLAQE